MFCGVPLVTCGLVVLGVTAQLVTFEGQLQGEMFLFRDGFGAPSPPRWTYTEPPLKHLDNGAGNSIDATPRGGNVCIELVGAILEFLF